MTEHSRREDGRPAFQFYPGDWMQDSELGMCDLCARGLWIELLCLMWKSERRGFLLVGGKPLPLDEQKSNRILAKLCRATEDEIKSALAQLGLYGVFSKDEQGVIYSRRMKRFADVLRAKSEAGIASGRARRGEQKTNIPPTDNQKKERTKDEHMGEEEEEIEHEDEIEEEHEYEHMKKKSTHHDPFADAYKAAFDKHWPEPYSWQKGDFEHLTKFKKGYPAVTPARFVDVAMKAWQSEEKYKGGDATRIRGLCAGWAQIVAIVDKPCLHQSFSRLGKTYQCNDCDKVYDLETKLWNEAKK